MRMVVDLPAPFGPRKPNTVPGCDAQVDVVDGDEIPEDPRQPVDLDRGGEGARPGISACASPRLRLEAVCAAVRVGEKHVFERRSRTAHSSTVTPASRTRAASLRGIEPCARQRHMDAVAEEDRLLEAGQRPQPPLGAARLGAAQLEHAHAQPRP